MVERMTGRSGVGADCDEKRNGLKKSDDKIVAKVYKNKKLKTDL